MVEISFRFFSPFYFLVLFTEGWSGWGANAGGGVRLYVFLLVLNFSLLNIFLSFGVFFFGFGVVWGGGG